MTDFVELAILRASQLLRSLLFHRLSAAVLWRRMYSCAALAVAPPFRLCKNADSANRLQVANIVGQPAPQANSLRYRGKLCGIEPTRLRHNRTSMFLYPSGAGLQPASVSQL